MPRFFQWKGFNFRIEAAKKRAPVVPAPSVHERLERVNQIELHALEPRLSGSQGSTPAGSQGGVLQGWVQSAADPKRVGGYGIGA
jgi:hypothetical protein